MVSDRQIRRLMSLLQQEQSLQVSADKAGMDRGTARKYRQLGQLPSAVRTEHDWRTRADAFIAVWPWVVEQLSLNSGLEARTLLEALQRAHPGEFADGQLRTLQRQVKRWRGLEGPGREVFFAQVHHPGRRGQSDFSHMTKLGVTIGGQSFAHLIYHFVLTYSNWEAFTLCYTESFESLSEGLQNALWELGGVPQRHRTDCVQELLLAKRELRLPKAIKKLSGYAALILDDLGYVQQNREEMEVLFTLLAERYERGSVLITSNLPFSQWELIFKDAMTPAAAIDRLVHHSVILELNLPSYRVEQARKSKAAATPAETPAADPK